MAPLPSECAAFASTLGTCFHSPKIEETTRAGFPQFQRDNTEEIEHLRVTCAQNLADLKADFDRLSAEGFRVLAMASGGLVVKPAHSKLDEANLTLNGT